MDGTANRRGGLVGTASAVARRTGRRLGDLSPRLGPSGSVRSEAGARAAVVGVSLVLSLGLTGLLHVVLAVVG